MSLPFSKDEFLAVFVRYNEAVWPMQWVLWGLAAMIVAILIYDVRTKDRPITIALSLLWVWMGAVYHLRYFTSVNPVAYVFGMLFVLQGLFLAWLAWGNRLHYRWPRARHSAIAATLFVYALVVYPLLNRALGHSYPEAPTFGLPCPTTIFTFGVLACLEAPYPRAVFAVPLFWAVVGSTAVFLFGLFQDAGLLIAAILVLPTVFHGRDGRRKIAG